MPTDLAASVIHAPFTRRFFVEDRVDSPEGDALREKLGIRVDSDPEGDCPAPSRAFDALGLLPEYALNALQTQGITEPTAIQAQALPLVLSGRDVVGLAQTGSGKTLAFLLPALTHMEAQEPIGGCEPMPIVLVVAPTRELAVQIAEEADKLLGKSWEGSHRSGLWAVCVYGGGNKRDQREKLLQGVHVLVATPGRLLDFIDSGFVSLKRVTYLVLDEADRMLDLGFQGDMATISSHVRRDRQVLFFSATWSSAVQELALGLCDPDGPGPTRISCGQGANRLDDAPMYQARDGIIQQVVVVDDSIGDWKQQSAQKRIVLERHLASVLEASEDHKVLVFVSQKQMADELARSLAGDGYAADSMHGGRGQEDRLWVLDQFRKSFLRLLVCTDVLGRGIDLPNVSHVVVYEMGAIEDYIHRIGRTGRGPHGKGHAFVFFEYWDQQPNLARELIEVLRASGQHVSEELRQLATDVASGKRRGASWAGGGWAGGSWSGGWASGGTGSANVARGDLGNGKGQWNDGSGMQGGPRKANAASVAKKNIKSEAAPNPPPAKPEEKVPEAWDAEEVPDSWDD